MPQRYQIVDRPVSRTPLDSQVLAQVLAQHGQLLLPMLDLIEHAEAAIDELIDVMGRATIEAVLLMSAAGVAGPKQQVLQQQFFGSSYAFRRKTQELAAVPRSGPPLLPGKADRKSLFHRNLRDEKNNCCCRTG